MSEVKTTTGLRSRFIGRFFLSGPDARRGIKMRLDKAVADGELPDIGRDIRKLASSRPRFWLLLPFAGNKKNIRSAQSVLGAFILLYCTVFLAVISKSLLFFGNMILSASLLMLILPISTVIILLVWTKVMLGWSLEHDKDPNLFLLKLWLLTKFRVSEISNIPIEALKLESYRIAYPVSAEKFRRTEKIAEMVKRIFGASFIVLIIALSIGPAIIQQRPDQSVPYFLLLAFGMFGAFTPFFIAQWIENMRSPIQISSQDPIRFAASPTFGNEVVILDILRDHFNDPTITRRLAKRARWFYYLGIICSWDYDLLPGVAFIIIILLASPLMAEVFHLTNNTNINATSLLSAFCLFAAIGLILLLLTILPRGARSQMKTRRSICKAFKDQRKLEEIVSFNDVLDSFVSRTYYHAYENNTIKDIATSWYVKALAKSLKREKEVP